MLPFLYDEKQLRKDALSLIVLADFILFYVLLYACTNSSAHNGSLELEPNPDALLLIHYRKLVERLMRDHDNSLDGRTESFRCLLRSFFSVLRRFSVIQYFKFSFNQLN